MNTAEALESITDRGLFELLVTSVLRKANREYETIIHTGINVRGVPIKSPLDGFCLVPESKPPKFIIVQHTTTELRGLERKWLYNRTSAKRKEHLQKKEDGDLIKAIHKAQKIRKRIPYAKFIVVLASNRRLSENLLEKVYQKAIDSRIDIDIWEQSRLADFLDTTAEGQWLRKRFLRIEAELLSKPLLEKLCQDSLSFFENELFLSSPRMWISREADVQIEQAKQSGENSIIFLVGESGFGKSVAAYKSLQKHVENGEIGLFMHAELIKECLSLEVALEKTIRYLHPRLQPEENKNILQFVKNNSRILIIIDDINRIENPDKLFQRIITWTKAHKSNQSDSHQSDSPYLIICPIWPHVWGTLKHIFEDISWIQTIFIRTLNSQEGGDALRKVTSEQDIEITDTEANELAELMGNDPYLIGLFSSLLTREQLNNLKKMAKNVVEKFISACIEETASEKDATYLVSEYRKALFNLTHKMLLMKKLYPLWEEVQVWFNSDSKSLMALRKLIQNAKLCRLNDYDKFTFRHDRILDAFLVSNITKILASGDLDNEILFEPFYAHLIGQALSGSNIDQGFIKKMQKKLPLALLEALRHFGAPSSSLHNTIIEEIERWWQKKVRTNLVPESVLDAVSWSLIETDSPAVIKITESYHPYPLYHLARFRNGCTKSGAMYCVGRHGLAPSYNDVLRDRILKHAKSRHEEIFLTELELLLKSTEATDEEREGYLALAGFLGFSTLQDEILKCWELSKDKTRVLPEAIWASTQCCGDNPSKMLDPLLKFWAGLSDEKDKHENTEKTKIAEMLCFALARGIHNDVVNYFIQLSKHNDSLCIPITMIMEHIDDPDAIEYIVQSVAKIDRENEGTGRFSPWSTVLTSRWDPSQHSGRHLSQYSLIRLKELWESQKSDRFLKKHAFRLWLTGVEYEQIDILRSIPSNSPLFRMALKKRIKLRDYRAISDLLPLIEKEIHWLDDIHNIWGDEFISPVKQHLDSLVNNTPDDFSGGWTDAHYFLSNLLMRIPESTAEQLFTEYWEYLGYSPLFIQAALYVGTKSCLKLADFSIQKCPQQINIFQHIGFRFDFWNEKRYYLIKQRLDNLVPYINRIKKSDLWHLADACKRLGIPEWTQKHISDFLSEEHRKRYNPSDNDLLQQLSEFEDKKHGVIYVKFWLEGFDKRHDQNERALNITETWLASNPTVERLRIASSCIQNVGTRNDLSILEKFEILGSLDEIKKIKESARFFLYRRSLE